MRPFALWVEQRRRHLEIADPDLSPPDGTSPEAPFDKPQWEREWRLSNFMLSSAPPAGLMAEAIPHKSDGAVIRGPAERDSPLTAPLPSPATHRVT